MSRVFEEYADFYDAYYVGKDYEREVEFVLSLAKEQGLEKIRSVLDIGCGTGGHLIPLCRRGLTVDGFDLSERMVEIGMQKIAAAGVRPNANIELGDATTYRKGKKYDLVISMFAVMGYLTSNKALSAGLRTAHAHLNTGGLFIFDVWFGPAVLHTLPETRMQEFTKDGLRTLRIVKPTLDVLQQIVTVDYTIFALKDNTVAKEVKESHRMRYFFPQELSFFLENGGFSLLKICPFLDSAGEVSRDAWNICVVAKATSQ